MCCKASSGVSLSLGSQLKHACSNLPSLSATHYALLLYSMCDSQASWCWSPLLPTHTFLFAAEKLLCNLYTALGTDSMLLQQILTLHRSSSDSSGMASGSITGKNCLQGAIYNKTLTETADAAITADAAMIVAQCTRGTTCLCILRPCAQLQHSS